MDKYLLVPLEDTVVFPNMTVNLPLDLGGETHVLLVPRHEGTYANVGTIAEVDEIGRLPGGGHGRHPHRPDARPARRGRDAERRPPVRRGRGAARRDAAAGEDARARDRVPRRRRGDPRAAQRRPLVGEFLRCGREPGALADTCGYSPDLRFEQRVELLETLDVVERLELAIRFQRERLAELQVRRRIRDDVESGAQKQQREYFLRKQIESIRKELGEDDGSVIDEYRKQIEEAELPEAVREQAERELGRLERMGERLAESSMIRTYLDWLLAVPWGKRSEERLDPTRRARCSTPTTRASTT